MSVDFFVAGKCELSSSSLTPYFVLGRLGGLAIGVFIKLTEQMFSRSAPSVFSWTKNNHGRWKEVTNDSWHQLPNSKKMSCHLNGTLMSRHQSSYHQQHEINFQAQQVFSGISSSYHQRRKPMFLTRSLGQSFFFRLERFGSLCCRAHVLLLCRELLLRFALTSLGEHVLIWSSRLNRTSIQKSGIICIIFERCM